MLTRERHRVLLRETTFSVMADSPFGGDWPPRASGARGADHFLRCQVIPGAREEPFTSER